MIEVDHTLLTPDALDNLLLDIITRQSTDYGEFEIDIVSKKNQLIQKLETGEALIVYYINEGFCDIIKTDGMKACLLQVPV